MTTSNPELPVKRGPGRPRKYPLPTPPEVQVPQDTAPEGEPVNTNEDGRYDPEEPDYKALLLATLHMKGIGRNTIIRNESYLMAKDGRLKLEHEFDPYSLQTILKVVNPDG